MIYVIESQGKGNGRADTVMLRTFLNDNEAANYVSLNVKRFSDSHKYWVRFDIVDPGEKVENNAE